MLCFELFLNICICEFFPQQGNLCIILSYIIGKNGDQVDDLVIFQENANDVLSHLKLYLQRLYLDIYSTFDAHYSANRNTIKTP